MKRNEEGNSKADSEESGLPIERNGRPSFREGKTGVY
jgi:hypothetical protein